MGKDTSERSPSSWPEFANQLESFPWQAVGKRACGPTAVAMAINIHNRLAGITSRVSPQEILFAAAKQSELPISEQKQHYLVINKADSEDLTRYVPIGNQISDSLQRDIEADAALSVETLHEPSQHELSTYVPVFTLNNGWDHRGSATFFAQYGIHAEQLGDPQQEKPPLDQIVNLIKEKHMLIGSVDYDEESTHVQLISDYDDSNGGHFLIHDPMSHGPMWVDVASWYKTFRGYGTLI